MPRKKKVNAISQGIRDVLTGRAATEGARIVFETIDKFLLPKSYKRDKEAYERIQKSRRNKR